MVSRSFHPYHLVDPSPWPILMSIALLSSALGLVLWITTGETHLSIPLFLVVLISFYWFRDIIREARAGHHTNRVQKGLMIGFILFLVTEVMVFFSLFWSFFHSSLNPSIELGSSWPPLGLNFIQIWAIPLLGSTVLLCSGFILTQSHHAFLNGQKREALWTMLITVLLGASFVALQYNEYSNSEFTIADSVFGSIFYITTGLHALHVIAGVLFLSIAGIRILLDQLTLENHLTLEFSIFYYHLVDVVWLLVFLVYYWWGS